MTGLVENKPFDPKVDPEEESWDDIEQFEK